MERRDGEYDLEERSFIFARDVRSFVKLLPSTDANKEDVPQLIRASVSTSANYLEANDALGKKDFRMRMKIARKEAKESRLFLRLVDCGACDIAEKERERLAKESIELKLIFSSIIQNSGE